MEGRIGEERMFGWKGERMKSWEGWQVDRVDK